MEDGFSYTFQAMRRNLCSHTRTNKPMYIVINYLHFYSCINNLIENCLNVEINNCHKFNHCYDM